MKCWCGGEVGNWQGEEPFCWESEFHDPFADGRPKKIDRLYIAGPMSGYPACNYPAFDLAEEMLLESGFEVANPTKVHIEGMHHYVDLIREDLRAMLDCQGVATLDNWWESVGARNEVQVAGVLKMPVRPLADWLGE